MSALHQTSLLDLMDQVKVGYRYRSEPRASSMRYNVSVSDGFGRDRYKFLLFLKPEISKCGEDIVVPLTTSNFSQLYMKEFGSSVSPVPREVCLHC